MTHRHDTQAITTLLRAILPDEQPHNEPSAVLELKTRTDNLCFIAAMDSTICGFVMGDFNVHRRLLNQLNQSPAEARW